MQINYSSIFLAASLLICSGCFRSETNQNVKSEFDVRLTDKKLNTRSVDPEHARTAEIATVYRHHPGLLPDLEDRNYDHDLILGVYERSTGGAIRIHGGLGHRGYAHEMSVEHIPNWVDGINELFASGKLKYYKDFGVDDNGIGLVKPENLPKQ